MNRDGHYYAFYDLGPQAKQPDIDGPFRIEGREGTYTLRTEAGSYALQAGWLTATSAAPDGSSFHDQHIAKLTRRTLVLTFPAGPEMPGVVEEIT